jgi:hypothetical protein
VIASARPCPPVPPLNLHGKEGVDGSSPSELGNAVNGGFVFLVQWLTSVRVRLRVQACLGTPQLAAFRCNAEWS